MTKTVPAPKAAQAQTRVVRERVPLTQQSAIAILMKYNAKIDLENKCVRDAQFLGNRLNAIVDYLVKNHRWGRTCTITSKPMLVDRLCL